MKSQNPSDDRKDPRQTIEVVKRNWRADAEERHAQRWEKKLIDLGAEPPVLKDTLGRRLNRWWNKIAGAEIAIRRMEAAEERHEAEFHDQAERTLAGGEDVQEFLRQSALEEKAHARALSAMAPPA